MEKKMETLTKSEIKTEIVHVDSALAMKLLSKNTKNRKVIDNSVNRYAKIMRDGKWKLNGDAIRVAEDGTLLDGQHRLKAIIETGAVVPMILVTGLPVDTFMTIDNGRKRTGGDVIGIYDDTLQKYQVVIAAALRIVNSFTDTGVYTGTEMKWGKFEHTELIKCLEKNKGIVKSVEYAYSLKYARKILPLACISALHYLFMKESRSDAEEFFYKLDSGVDLSLNHPVNLLRRRLFDMHEAKSRTLTHNVLPYVVKAWELFREGREVTVLRVDDDYVPVIK